LPQILYFQRNFLCWST